MSIQGKTLTPRHRWRTLHVGKLVVLFVSLLGMCLSAAVFSPSAFAATTGPTPPLKHATFTLDGVTVNITTPFLPGQFITSKSGDATQTATAGTPGLNVHPYGAIYVTAVPFGTKPRTENVPIAQAGSAAIYRMSLYQYRVREGDNPQPGPVITLFGQQVTGEASLMLGNVKQAFSSTVVVEWVVEAGERIWIVRITQEEPLGTINLKPAASLLASLRFLTFTSSTLTQLTTVKISVTKAAVTNAVLSNYPSPPWWSSTCHDADGSSPSGSYSMANWHGIDACGPIGTANNSSFGGRSPVLASEWQCAELPQRYFLVAGYLNQTYSASGAQMVTNYPASNMDKIANGTVGRAPQAGDVMSYNNPNNVNGHTTLVTSSSVDGNGNGHITILQQNSSGSNGPLPTDTLTVSNWNVVNDWNATITGWLDPNSGGTPPPPVKKQPYTFVGSNADGRLEVFTRKAADNNIWHNAQTSPNGQWGGWAPLQTTSITFQGTPIVASNQDGRLEVFARGTDNNIYHNAQTSPNGQWGGWAAIQGGQQFSSDPAVGANADGHLEVFAIGTDHNIYHVGQTSPNGQWNTWVVLQSGSYSFQKTPTIGVNADGRIEIFVLGSDNNIWHNAQTAPNGFWGGWANLSNGSFQGIPTVASNQDGRLEVFVQGTDTNIWHNAQTSPNGQWGGWAAIQGGQQFTSAPAVGANADGHLEVFAVGTDNNIYHVWQGSPNGQWNTWAVLQSGSYSFQDTPAVGGNADGRIEIFVLGSDNNIWHNAQTAPNGSWGGWATL